MITIPRWLKDIFAPEIYQGLLMDEIMGALNDPHIRRHWVAAMLDEIRICNVRAHAVLAGGGTEAQFKRESCKVQGIEWTMRQILNSKTSVELDRHHKRADPFDGVSVEPV